MFTNVIIGIMKYTWSLVLFCAIISPVSILLEGSITETLLQKSEYSFLVLSLCVLGNIIVYLIKCGMIGIIPKWSSFLAGGIRVAFYALIVMTAFNYEVNMVQIYGEKLPESMWYVTTIRHILINMMIIYELEMINKNYKSAFGSNLPIIGMVVKIRDGIQKKILSKFSFNAYCPLPEEGEEKEII